MKVKTLGLLAVGTVMLSVCAGMTLSAKDIETKPDGVIVEKKKTRPKMDLAFCIDTTGSMQGEIDMVKAKVKDLVAKLCSGNPAPIVRVGLVAFRDRGDEYVTKVYPFSDDIDKFVKDISELQAAGGGDGPESVNEALHVSVDNLAWDGSNKTAKLLFLIGDAEPHFYVNDYKWEDECRKAIAKGIQINTLGCDGLEASGGKGVDVFKQIAKLTDGQFENLAYRQIVKDDSGRETTIISSGGASYAVAEGAAGEWKRGAKELSTMGKARALSAAPLASRSVGMTRAKMSSFSAAAGVPGSEMAGGMAGDMAAADMAYTAPAAANRKDSNLDSLMYDAAMKKAKEKLDVDF